MSDYIKQEADSAIALFKPFANGKNGSDMEKTCAIACATVMYEEIIEEVEGIIGSQKHMWSEHQKEAMDRFNNILNHLKSL